MFATTARRSTAFLLFAALQFVVLTSVAMRLYPDYRFGAHFLNHFGRLSTEELSMWRGEEPEIPGALRR